MKEFFIKLGDNPIYKKIFKEPLTYVAGAVLLSIFQIAHFATLQRGWGVTGPFAAWAGKVAGKLGVNVDSWFFFEEMAPIPDNLLLDGATLRNIGIIVGALLATLFASQFKIKKLKSYRQVIAAVLGGLLMGYGARLAMGCNIGALFTGTASLSLAGWVFAACLLAGAFVGGKLLVKFFM